MLLNEIVRLRSRYTPDENAIEFGEVVYTFARLEDRINRCARVIADMGIDQGDRVAILAKNTPEFLEIAFAAGMVGAIAIPINYRLSPSEIEEQMSDALPRVLFVEPDLDDVKMRGTAERVVEMSLPGNWNSEYSRMIDASESRPASRLIREDDPILLQYTSGTTGRAKGVLSSHAGWSQSCMMEPAQKGLTVDSVFLGALPLCHTGGLKWAIHSIFTGATLVLMRRFDEEEARETIATHDVTHISVVPTLLRSLLSGSTDELKDLKYINYGGSPMPQPLLREALERLNCGFTQSFGMTEVAGGSITFLGADDHLLGEDGQFQDSLDSVGRPMMDCDIRVVSESGAELALGEVGELVVRSKRTLMRYWGGDGPPIDQRGFYHTGDLGTMDRRGFIRVVDRKKDMIISGGLNVYAREVELLLERHTDVAEAYVVGRPHPKWGEGVNAVVVREQGCEVVADELTKWCKDRAAHYKCPTNIVFVGADEIPRTALGKVRKDELMI